MARGDGMKWIVVKVMRELRGAEAKGPLLSIQEARGPFDRATAEGVQRWMNEAEKRDHPHRTGIGSAWEVVPLDPTPPKALRKMRRGAY